MTKTILFIFSGCAIALAMYAYQAHGVDASQTNLQGNAPAGTNVSTRIAESNTNGSGLAAAKKSAEGDKCSLTEVLDSNLASAFVGLIGGAVGFFVARRLEDQKATREEDNRYCCLLESISNELEFYAGKLEFLSGQLRDFLAGTGVVPSYTFYPAFLEQGKLRMNDFMRNSNLVKEVGHCHFELHHICERLEVFKRECNDATLPPPLRQANTQGFKRLVDSNVPVFRANAAALRQVLEHLR